MKINPETSLIIAKLIFIIGVFASITAYFFASPKYIFYVGIWIVAIGIWGVIGKFIVTVWALDTLLFKGKWAQVWGILFIFIGIVVIFQYFSLE